ncbi:uncharacterized protein LOC131536829 isoform X1 [Onychostoma macrolepis]|uniref:uncharacterized protein LOC131536829 isoform X1 n=1 Tax=Onychostoma macrolepis TaxID=369639 RepID=UPI00272B1B62|nr:uncharacterized protein LOC131536829 isoform X1 [Onychostoma macrolepis]XP_058625949.1 uncharacterized protein LOC131536829 isoform X1 [Onychostoma macrolepis]
MVVKMSRATKPRGPTASKERKGKGHNVYTPVQMVLFNFIRLPLQPHHNSNKTITQILQMDMEYQSVNIRAKCIQLESEGHNILQDGTFLEKTTCTIADTTGVVERTVWGLQHNINIESWFYMTNLSLCIFQGKKFLSTTKDTTFPIELTTSECITANIMGAKVNGTYICPLKHQLKDMALSCSRVLCHKCDILQVRCDYSTHSCKADNTNNI